MAVANILNIINVIMTSTYQESKQPFRELNPWRAVYK